MPVFLGVAAMVLANGMQSNGENKPLHLHFEQQGAMKVFSVVGSATEPRSIAYELRVSDGGNRSIQRGVAHLDAAVRTTVATVRVKGKGPLSARLSVKQAGSDGYEESFGSE